MIAPDFFARSDDVDPNDFGAVIGSITPANLKADFAAAADALRADGATSIGVTGFCMGGWFTYRAAMWADDLGVSAAVPFYGGGIARELGEPACPTLMFFGGQRPVHPHRRHREGAGTPRDAVVVYPGADHGFMRDGSENYDPDRPPTRGRACSRSSPPTHLGPPQVRPRATITRISATAPSRSRLDVTIGMPWLSGSSPSRWAATAP